MSVYRPKNRRSFEYDFWFDGERYRGNTKQVRLDDARRVEAKIQERLRHQAGGIAIPQRDDSPRFQEWAEVFYRYKAQRLERPDALANILPKALSFWGCPLGLNDVPIARTDHRPCHDLRLIDPILHPEWIVQFEAWLAGQGLSNQSKNHYRGLLRRMYQVALLPEFRTATGVYLNPFAGVPNDPTMERTVTLTPPQVRRVLQHASYHVRLALAIAALAPKLRLRNILELRWASNFVPDPRTRKFKPTLPYFIEVQHHKTMRRTRRPLVTPITTQLLRILKDAWRRSPQSEAVVVYRAQPVKNIVAGVKAAVEAAGLPYGRDLANGATFHTMRHTAATLLSEGEPDPLKLMDATGHTDLATTLKYRHLRPSRQRPTLERLSRKLQLASVVMKKTTRVTRKKAG